LGNGNADINSLDRGCRRFFCVSGWMELGGYPAQDIEADSNLVSVLSVNALLQVETLLDEEMSPGFSRFTPALSKAVLAIGTPGIQLAEWRQFRMIAEQLDEGTVASAEEREKVVRDFLSKRLRSAFRPGYIAISPLWKGVELGQSRVHSGL